MIVVSDSTPLISLMKAGQLSVLEGLYREILVPDAVFRELTSNPKYAEEADLIRTSAFIKTVEVREEKAVDVLQRVTGLDRGESEAIIFADENKAHILLMDEEAGRRVARAMGLHIQGTIGVLLRAYDEALLSADQVMEALDRLRGARRHISEKMYGYAAEYVRRQA